MGDISINDGMASYMSALGTNNYNTSKADNTKDSLHGLSSQSTEEELRDAVKSFETYFVEQVIKKVKESTTSLSGDEEDSTISQYKDLYMDSVISDIASDLVDNMGGSLTDDLVAQLKRNYGIE